MDLTKVILGEVVTEKAIRLKSGRVSLLRIHPQATKVDIANALRRYFGTEPEVVRIVNVKPKRRLVGRGRFIQKRDPVKRAYVTLSVKSKALDLTKFQK